MKIKINKTKVMRISRTKGRLLTETIIGSKFEQFKQFFYLGSMINGGLQMPHGNRKKKKNAMDKEA